MRLLIVDTETSGLDPDRHALLSVGLVVWEDGVQLASDEIRIHHDELTVQHKALQVNDIDLRRTHNVGCTPHKAVSDISEFIYQWFRKEGISVIVAGHNPKFDLAFLQRLYARSNTHTFETYFPRRALDTTSVGIFLGLLEGGPPNSEGYSLNALLDRFGLASRGDTDHSAQRDAELCGELLNKMIERAGTWHMRVRT